MRQGRLRSEAFRRPLRTSPWLRRARCDATPAVRPTSRADVRRSLGRCLPNSLPQLQVPVRDHARVLVVVAALRNAEGFPLRRFLRSARMYVPSPWVPAVHGAVRTVRFGAKVRLGREVDTRIIQKMSEAHRGSRTVRRSIKESSKSTEGTAVEFAYRTRSVIAPNRLSAGPPASGPGRYPGPLAPPVSSPSPSNSVDRFRTAG